MQLDKDLRSVQEVRNLIAAAREAQRVLAGMDQKQLDAIVAAISRAGAEDARRLGDMAVEETGFGRKEDKELKNRFAAVTLYDAIKDERTIGILAEDREKKTIDIGVPVLSMHSPFEIVSKADVYMAYLTFKAFCEDAE